MKILLFLLFSIMTVSCTTKLVPVDSRCFDPDGSFNPNYGWDDLDCNNEGILTPHKDPHWQCMNMFERLKIPWQLDLNKMIDSGMSDYEYASEIGWHSGFYHGCLSMIRQENGE